MMVAESIGQVSFEPGRPLYLTVRDAVRTAINNGTEGEKAVPRELAMKITPATMIRPRRPKRSVNAPPTEAPTTAPTRTALTTISSIVDDRLNCLVMKRMAPEITPVS